jgi:asparagine synthetase B (glutamine-hydrolysing)
MCGIYVTVAQHLSGFPTNDSYPRSTAPEWLHRRGPDGCNHTVIRSHLNTSSGAFEQNVFMQATIFASVLRLRSVYAQQPIDLLNMNPSKTLVTAAPETGHIDCKGSAYFAWNGEVYEFYNIETDSVEPAFSHKISDTALVYSLLSKQVVFGNTSILHQQQQIAHVMGQLINAEYAFCIATAECIFYGRDVFGRRSLLTGTSQSCSTTSFQYPQWFVASVAASSFIDANILWEEVEPGLVHAYELNQNTLDPLKALQSKPVRIPCSFCFNATVGFPQLIQRIGESENVSQQFHSLLLEAVRRRCGATTGDPNDLCWSTETAVLFSGGLDSAVVAALALKAGVSSLTLLTVSFVDYQDIDKSSVPAADAVSAKQTYLELCQLFPNSKIKFVHRIVDWNDVVSAEERLRTLAFPKTDSVMDVNIATALWFASSAADASMEDVPPRILLSGLGADELLGGYGRHRTAWNQGGYEELQKELTMDLNRLWQRNLGRDDRVISDTGKEVRFPFLDLNVVQFIQQIPLQYVVDYEMDNGEGDKRILRLVAEQIGLKSASRAIKRAIQFGSRISHVSDKRRFGSRRKANGATKRK